MNAKQIKEATKLAQNKDIDLSSEDDSILLGCGLPEFKPVYTTVRIVAKFMKYQCAMFNGNWDWTEYNENLIPVLRRKVFVV